METKKEFSN